MEKGNSIKLVEVCRSFSRTAQVVSFEPRNFFCSLKEECKVEDIESTSNRLIHFFKMTDEKEVEEYINEHKPDNEKVITVEQSYKPKVIVSY
jgi:hypothetical protein